MRAWIFLHHVRQAVARHRAGGGKSSSWQFECGARVAVVAGAGACCEAGVHSDDDPGPVYKEHIERKAHPHHVHRPAGLEQQPFALTKPVAPEQPSQALPPAARVGDMTAQHGVAGEVCDGHKEL
jgi:hypothetical protein